MAPLDDFTHIVIRGGEQVAELVLPAKHTLNGVGPFLEDRHVELCLAAAFGGLPTDRSERHQFVMPTN